MKAFMQTLSKIDALSLRERVAVFVACLVVMFYAWDLLLMQPVVAKERSIRAEITRKTSERDAMQAQIRSLQAQKASDPDVLNKQRLSELKQRLGNVEKQLKASTNQLISPKDMAQLLESVLLRVKGLTLINIKGLGGVPVVQQIETADNKLEQKSDGLIENAYKHGLRIEFEGDYLATLEYVKELESLEWDFFWDSLEFSVEQYPDSRVVITVFTLSLDENWIGV